MIRRNSLFWGVLLVAFGFLLLLNTLGILNVSAWNLIWPFALILVGAWVLVGVFGGPRGSDLPVENATIPLENAQQAGLEIHHGAGRLTIGGNATPGNLVQGSFGGGLECRKTTSGDRLTVELRPRWDNRFMWGFPFNWSGRNTYDWNVSLTREIPLTLRLETGAGESCVDLTDLCVPSLTVKTGASNTELTLPANAGQTSAKLEAGAASLKVHIPGGVAARIRTQSGLSSVLVDQTRFPLQGTESGGVYLSPNYASASNKVDLDIEVGIGSVKID